MSKKYSVFLAKKWISSNEFSKNFNAYKIFENFSCEN